MTETPHQACPYTDCGSSDAFSWNTEGYGKCHSCNKSYPSKKKLEVFDWVLETYKLEKKTKIEEVEIASTTYDGIRSLDPEVAKLYGIQLQLDADGNPVRYAFKHKSNVKYRGYDEKKFWVKNRGVKMNEFFGPDVNSGSSTRLYVTEGEFDAASLFQILGKTFPVLSFPSASWGDEFIKKNHEFLSPFKEIVYAGELDKAGRQSADRLYKAYPEKLWYVPMTKWKDANEFLQNGDGQELMWAARKPQRYSPENFFCSDDEFLKIIREENPYEATPTGHSGIDYQTRGLVRGGVMFIKAPPGTGKTEIVRFFERAMLQTEDTKIALIHMEEMKSTTLRSMATYELGKNVRTKEDQLENGVSDAELEEAVLKAAKGERTIIFEMRAADDPLQIIDYVSLAARIYGADYIFIDHVQRLTYLGGVDGATNILTQIASNLAQLGKELNIGIIVISHVNEDGHTKYAKSLEEEAIICLKIERDKEAEDETLKNTTQFIVEKNRPFSRLGPAGSVYFNPETTILEEVSFDV
jgi:twinkle protein